MITFQIETIDDVREEILPMLHAHYIEIATSKGIRPLDIDWDKYYAMEKAGTLRVLTARARPQMVAGQDYYDGQPGRLVGYFVSFVLPHIHYQQTLTALNDIMYLDPAYRGGTTGYRMLKEAILDLKNLGADILIIHMKVEYPFRNLLEKLGFHLTEENWERVL